MKLDDWGKWTGWEPLVLADFSKIPTGPGAYIIAANGKICRAVAKDEEGILDVGESINLCSRIKAFIACANGNRKKGHMAGWRYRAFGFDTPFPLKTLRLSWHKASSKKKAYDLEAYILKEYLRQHYELPPLNYKYNWARQKP